MNMIIQIFSSLCKRLGFAPNMILIPANFPDPGKYNILWSSVYLFRHACYVEQWLAVVTRTNNRRKFII